MFTCWAMTDNTSRSILLNSSKQAQAPADARPLKNCQKTTHSHEYNFRQIILTPNIELTQTLEVTFSLKKNNPSTYKSSKSDVKWYIMKMG